MFEFSPEYLRNEKEVESKFIVNYLLPALGYTAENWHQEVALGGVRLDFLVFASRVLSVRLSEDTSACLVIEAKSPKRKLSSHIRRLRQYLEMLQTTYGLLTNGKEVRIYQRKANDTHLIFQCAGRDIDKHMGEIKAIIGREALRPKPEAQQPKEPQIEAYREEVQKSHEVRSKQEKAQLDVTERSTIDGSVYTKPESIHSETTQPQTPPFQISLADTPQSPIEQPESHPTVHVPNPTERNQNSMKVIAIYHNKGGVGKTTVSVNLAAALRNKGHRVLLIDLDSQANSTFAMGLIKFQFEEEDDLRENNILHVLKSGDFNFIPDVARQSNLFNEPEIDIIPSHIGLIEEQYEINQRRPTHTRLIKKLQREEKNYDFVIIDTPPSRDIYAQVAIIAANYLIIPSDMKPFANQGLSSVRSFLKEIDEFKEQLGRKPINILGVLPSKVSTNRRAFERTFPRQKETILNRYDFPIMDSIIFERAALSHAVNQMRTIGDLEIPDPKSIFMYASQNSSANQAASEFEDLAAEVLSKTE